MSDSEGEKTELKLLYLSKICKAHGIVSFAKTAHAQALVLKFANCCSSWK